MAATPRQWVTIVAACAVVSLLVHMAMYTGARNPPIQYNNGNGNGNNGNGWLNRIAPVNDTPPAWATQLTAQIAKTNREISKLGQQLSNVHTDVKDSGDNNESLGAVTAKQAELHTQIAAMSTKLEALSRLDGLKSQTDSLDDQIKKMTATLSQIASSLTTLTTSTTDANKGFASISTEIQKLSTSLTTLQTSVEANSKAVAAGAGAAGASGTGQLHHWKFGDQDKHADKVALIIESRPVHRLIRVVKQFMSVMAEDWEFQIWFSNLNEKMLRDSPDIQAMMRAGRLRMYPMGRDTFDIPWYNQLMMRNHTFWDFVGGKHMLIFQVDAVLCPKSPKKIEDFLGYDYCGAPWASPWYGDAGGNGGLSLRGRDATLKCARDWRGYGANEDGYFTECVAHAEERGERKICRRELAKTFSVETIYYPTPWGVHNAWQYLKPDETHALQQWCPEMADARKPLGFEPD